MKYLLIISAVIFLSMSTAMAQWTTLYSGTTVNLNGIQFINPSNGFCIGDDGIFLSTNDGGTTWQTKMFVTGEQFTGIQFIDNTTGFICSNNHLYKTTDGGMNFTEITYLLQHPDTPTKMMDQIEVVVNDTMAVITAVWYADTAISLKSSNSGSSWLPIKLPAGGAGDITYSIVNTNVIYAAVSNMQFKTLDGGETWTMVRTLPFSVRGDNGFRIFDLSGIGYANCGYGTAFVHFYNDVTDTGVNNETIVDPHSISFINVDTGYFLRYNILFKTLDGGITKTAIDTFSEFPIPYKWHVCFANASIGFICGENGTIYKTTTGGITAIQNPERKGVSVYPNPAAEKINLQYDWGMQVQSIRLTDMQGRTIKDFGKDEKTLDVHTVASGTYFLLIQTAAGSIQKQVVISK
jgi:photosystem II stability/assembly factor-like uncharacterized protein